MAQTRRSQAEDTSRQVRRATRRPPKSFVYYEGPSGRHEDRLHNPTADQLLEAVRQEEESWDTNISGGWMAWHTDARAVRHGLQPASLAIQRMLVFLKNAHRGWYFEYSDKSETDQGQLVPFDVVRQRGRRIGHFYCDWVYLLPGCFVPFAVAEQVMRDFLLTGRPSPAVRWVDGVRLRSRISGDEKDRSMGRAEPTTAADRPRD
jgi:hypothetical protein